MNHDFVEIVLIASIRTKFHSSMQLAAVEATYVLCIIVQTECLGRQKTKDIYCTTFPHTYMRLFQVDCQEDKKFGKHGLNTQTQPSTQRHIQTFNQLVAQPARLAAATLSVEF